MINKESISIFADQLFAFHYDGETYNEYDRLMELWTDINYLKKYAHDNGVEDVNDVFDEDSFYELYIELNSYDK